MNVRYDWYGLVYWIFLLATEPTGSSISNVLQAAEHNISTLWLHMCSWELTQLAVRLNSILIR